MKLIYLKPALKCDSFDVAIGIKIPFFRVLVTIEPGRSLLQFVTTNCLIHSHKLLDQTPYEIACAIDEKVHEDCQKTCCLVFYKLVSLRSQ